MLLIGTIILVMGIAAEVSNQPSFNWILLGILLAFLGLILWRRLSPRRRRNTRFSLFRRHRGENEWDEDNNKDDLYYE